MPSIASLSDDPFPLLPASLDQRHRACESLHATLAPADAEERQQGPILGTMSMRWIMACLTLGAAFAGGCQSPHYADRGATAGGLAGAGIGALVGSQTGDAGAGAMIGAGLGAITGGLVGGEMDRLAAENRAAIASQMGRQVSTGAATVDEVVAMSQAGVNPQLIAQYVQTSGVAQPATAQDVVFMTQNGVSDQAIQAMLNPPAPQVAAVPVSEPVIIEQHHYCSPVFYPPPRRHHCRPARGPRMGWSVSIGN